MRLVFFSPVKSVCGVGFTGQHVPRRVDGSARAGPRLGDKRGGQGLSSDGIHTEDVEIDIVRGAQSFLNFSCWPATEEPQNQTLRTRLHLRALIQRC